MERPLQTLLAVFGCVEKAVKQGSTVLHVPEAMEDCATELDELALELGLDCVAPELELD